MAIFIEPFEGRIFGMMGIRCVLIIMNIISGWDAWFFFNLSYYFLTHRFVMIFLNVKLLENVTCLFITNFISLSKFTGIFLRKRKKIAFLFIFFNRLLGFFLKAWERWTQDILVGNNKFEFNDPKSIA